MKRKFDIRLILVLLILSIMPLYLPLVVNSDVIASLRNPSTFREMNTSWDSNYKFSWTSRLQTEPLLIRNGSTIVGDHIVIRSTWNESVESSRISISHGFNKTRNGTIEPPGSDDEWPVPLCQRENPSWETFDVQAGDEVRIRLNVSQNGDSAFQVYPWSDTDSDNEVDSEEIGNNSYISEDIGGAGHAESGSYISPVSESIAIKILSLTWAYSENMIYILEVDTWDSVVIKNEPDYPSEVLFDTYNLLRNATVNLTISATTYNGVFSIEYIGISFGNYFTPKLDVNSPISLDPEPPPLQVSGFPLPRPISQGRWNFTWTCSDLNVNDSNYYSVWLSSDGGSTFQLLERNLTETFFVWDSDGFLQGNNYMYRVRAYSLDFTIREDNASLCSTGNPPESYWPGDYTDAVSVDFRTHASPIIFRSQPTISTTEDNVIATTPSDSTVPPDSPVLVVAIGLSAGMISGLGLLEVFRRKGLKKNE